MLSADEGFKDARNNSGSCLGIAICEDEGTSKNDISSAEADGEAMIESGNMAKHKQHIINNEKTSVFSDLANILLRV